MEGSLCRMCAGTRETLYQDINSDGSDGPLEYRTCQYCRNGLEGSRYNVEKRKFDLDEAMTAAFEAMMEYMKKH